MITGVIIVIDPTKVARRGNFCHYAAGREINLSGLLDIEAYKAVNGARSSIWEKVRTLCVVSSLRSFETAKLLITDGYSDVDMKGN